MPRSLSERIDFPDVWGGDDERHQDVTVDTDGQVLDPSLVWELVDGVEVGLALCGTREERGGDDDDGEREKEGSCKGYHDE